jgi:hypothetical protein
MYIRFETDVLFTNRDCPKGIFAAMGDCKRSGRMTLRGHIWYVSMASWFNENLDYPSCFLQPVLPEVKFRALSWFTLKFNEVLSMALRVVEFLRFNGFTVNTLVCNDPGIPVFKSAQQIVAIPFDL